MGSLRTLLVLAICLFLQISSWGQESCENLSVIGGQNVFIQDAPYIAAIIENGEAVCVGTIVHESFILTAASCASDGGPQKVLLGTARLNNGGKYYDVAEEICHFDYNTETIENDVCLLKLKSKIKFGRRVAKVQLPPANIYIADGSLLNVTGWGSTDSFGNTYPERLQRTSVPKVSKHCCSEVYDGITEDMICAGKQGHDACEGDGGAPLTLHSFLVGVFSTGASDGCGSSPGIYTKVPSYLNWIHKMIEYNS